MSHIYTSADQLTGGTPLLELTHVEQDYHLEARVLAKLEYFNPAGSVKDRVAKAMLDDAEARGVLKPTAVSSEPTSGLPDHHCDAGDDECGTAAAHEGIRCGAGID